MECWHTLIWKLFIDHVIETKLPLIIDVLFFSHERTHTGVRPYICLVCNRSFIQKSQLTAHEATHNYHHHHTSISNDSPPTTIIDPIAPTTIAIESPPMKKQNEYVCKYCGKRYAYASSLYVHTRLHTGERFVVTISIFNQCYFEDRSNVNIATRHSQIKAICRYHLFICSVIIPYI
jgi:uncharacterized Zn-finger protein